MATTASGHHAKRCTSTCNAPSPSTTHNGTGEESKTQGRVTEKGREAEGWEATPSVAHWVAVPHNVREVTVPHTRLAERPRRPRSSPALAPAQLRIDCRWRYQSRPRLRARPRVPTSPFPPAYMYLLMLCHGVQSRAVPLGPRYVAAGGLCGRAPLQVQMQWWRSPRALPAPAPTLPPPPSPHPTPQWNYIDFLVVIFGFISLAPGVSSISALRVVRGAWVSFVWCMTDWSAKARLVHGCVYLCVLVCTCAHLCVPVYLCIRLFVCVRVCACV